MEPDDFGQVEYRQKHFAVEVVPCRHPTVPGEVELKVSHNGYQFQGISLTPSERIAVIGALLNYKDLSPETVTKASDLLNKPCN